MRLPRFEYLSPKTLEEAAALLGTYGNRAKILAGGTDLLVDLKKGSSIQGDRWRGEKKRGPLYVIGLRGVTGLTRLNYSPGETLSVGPMTTYADVADSTIVKENYPLLWHACRTFSRPQVRSAGTLVGNVCNASPSADLVPPLIALGATAKVFSARADREVAVEEFCSAPFKTVLKEGELVAEIKIPQPAQPYGWSYQRTAKRTAEDEALVVVAVLLEFADRDKTVGRARIALGSVAPKPLRALESEGMTQGKKLDEALIQKISETASIETRPRSRSDYRRLMTSYLVRKALTEAIGN